MSVELEHIWSRVQAQLALVVEEPTYRIWLAPLRAAQLSENQLLVEAPPHSCGWIHDRFGRMLQSAVEQVLGGDVVLELLSAQPAGERLRGARPHDTSPGSEHHPADDLRPADALANPKLTFEQFVIGDSNRLAHAAALTVAEMPAQAYNPLFICGPPGVGKTHLLSAMADLLRTHSPGLTVRWTTGEAFTNEFLGALSAKHTEQFKARFRHVDVLLMDDVQFLQRKTRTEEEFFHTFNALHDGGSQVVITSDRPPHDLQALEDRLRERFEAGLVADIRPPERSTRLAILRKRAQHDHIDAVDDTALQLIADRIDTNVRALEGALIRVVAFSSLTRRPLTAELVSDVLDGLYPANKRSRQTGPPTITEIQAAACEVFGISADELLSRARTPRIAWPRQVAMYLARELTHESLPAIGRHFGGRDHTTVLHACRRASTRITSDDSSRQAVENLFTLLRSHPPR